MGDQLLLTDEQISFLDNEYYIRPENYSSLFGILTSQYYGNDPKRLTYRFDNNGDEVSLVSDMLEFFPDKKNEIMCAIIDKHLDGSVGLTTVDLQPLMDVDARCINNYNNVDMINHFNSLKNSENMLYLSDYYYEIVDAHFANIDENSFIPMSILSGENNEVNLERLNNITLDDIINDLSSPLVIESGQIETKIDYIITVFTLEGISWDAVPEDIKINIKRSFEIAIDRFGRELLYAINDIPLNELVEQFIINNIQPTMQYLVGNNYGFALEDMYKFDSYTKLLNLSIGILNYYNENKSSVQLILRSSNYDSKFIATNYPNSEDIIYDSQFIAKNYPNSEDIIYDFSQQHLVYGGRGVISLMYAIDLLLFHDDRNTVNAIIDNLLSLGPVYEDLVEAHYLGRIPLSPYAILMKNNFDDNYNSYFQFISLTIRNTVLLSIYELISYAYNILYLKLNTDLNSNVDLIYTYTLIDNIDFTLQKLHIIARFVPITQVIDLFTIRDEEEGLYFIEKILIVAKVAYSQDPMQHDVIDFGVINILIVFFHAYGQELWDEISNIEPSTEFTDILTTFPSIHPSIARSYHELIIYLAFITRYYNPRFFNIIQTFIVDNEESSGAGLSVSGSLPLVMRSQDQMSLPDFVGSQDNDFVSYSGLQNYNNEESSDLMGNGGEHMESTDGSFEDDNHFSQLYDSDGNPIPSSSEVPLLNFDSGEDSVSSPSTSGSESLIVDVGSSGGQEVIIDYPDTDLTMYECPSMVASRKNSSIKRAAPWTTEGWDHVNDTFMVEQDNVNRSLKITRTDNENEFNSGNHSGGWGMPLKFECPNRNDHSNLKGNQISVAPGDISFDRSGLQSNININQLVDSLTVNVGQGNNRTEHITPELPKGKQLSDYNCPPNLAKNSNPDEEIFSWNKQPGAWWNNVNDTFSVVQDNENNEVIITRTDDGWNSDYNMRTHNGGWGMPLEFDCPAVLR